MEAAKIFVLYDLFVAPSARKQGVAIQLMNTARDYAREDGAKRLDLDTHETNIAGQHLYEKLGYKRVLDDFIAYSLWL
ncbi:hypothetical protein NFHSH190041_08150 [Shewanella sp. NFH-SH190041]|uniref:GNAT family N-acetyltransferase n=1 Tax=Shewanella sp. NFH-SH190041 TaxID=2950245 RepID=UPI0021C4BDA9|nr:GNAT family N-acetyltransferase [Shewanella sp. NFH-SH190041]BDM63363.1 hypothetical protein NFHSH190041_08150 [Shewanella sp. NFH-SH190041]